MQKLIICPNDIKLQLLGNNNELTNNDEEVVEELIIEEETIEEEAIVSENIVNGKTLADLPLTVEEFNASTTEELQALVDAWYEQKRIHLSKIKKIIVEVMGLDNTKSSGNSQNIIRVDFRNKK